MSAAILASAARSSDVEAGTRRDAEALLERITKESGLARAEAAKRERDADMLQRLADVRIPKDDLHIEKGWQQEELRRMDEAYARAFADYLGGRPLLEQPLDAAAAALRGDITVELATFFDHWSAVRRGLGEPNGMRLLRDLAARLDPEDSWRSELRAVLHTAAKDEARLQRLVASADYARLSAASCGVLFHAMRHTGARETAISVLARAREAKPDDFYLCFGLGMELEALPDPPWERILHTYDIARALRPTSKAVLHRQGVALEYLGRPDEAERTWRTLHTLEPRMAFWLVHLGVVAAMQGRLPEAIVFYRRGIAIERRPNWCVNLGVTLQVLGKTREAMEVYQELVAADGGCADAHARIGDIHVDRGEYRAAADSLRRAVAIDANNARYRVLLAGALKGLDRVEEAIDEYEAAIRIDPEDSVALCNLGLLFLAQGNNREARRCYERAREVDPRFPLAYANLGGLSLKEGRHAEAVRHFRKWLAFSDSTRPTPERNKPVFLQNGALHWAARPKPNEWAQCYNMMGLAYKGLDQLAEAKECYGHALEIDQGHAPTHVNLGTVLALQGDPSGALREYRTAQSLFERQDTEFAREWVGRCRDAIATQLPLAEPTLVSAVLEGDRPLKSSVEWTAIVRAGYTRGCFEEIVGLTERTLASNPELIDGDPWGTYNPARAAARLAAGPAAKADAERGARLRELARAWLSRSAERWMQHVRAADLEAAASRDHLRHALQDSDFARVRGEALPSLPEAERMAWQELWKRIARASTENGR